MSRPPGYKTVKHVGAFRQALDEMRVGKQFEVAADARLALAEHLDEFGHGQLAAGQEAGDAQPRRLGQGFQLSNKIVHAALASKRYKDMFISFCTRFNGEYEKGGSCGAALSNRMRADA